LHGEFLTCVVCEKDSKERPRNEQRCTVQKKASSEFTARFLKVEKTVAQSLTLLKDLSVCRVFVLFA